MPAKSLVLALAVAAAAGPASGADGVEGPSKSAPRSAAKALPPRGDKAPPAADQRGKTRPISARSSMFTGLAGLAVVLVLFFVVARLLRCAVPGGAAPLPIDAVEVLGRAALAGRQHAHLVRCGNKILLVYLAPGVAETLTEISDPAEVERLSGICRQSRSTSGGASFRQMLQQFGGEKRGTGLHRRRVASRAIDSLREGADA